MPSPQSSRSTRADAGRSSSAAPACTIARSCAGSFPVPAPTRRCAAGSRPSRDAAASSFCIACSQRVDPRSAARIQPRDLKRMVRALEVYFLTGTPLTDHFAATVSPLAGYQTVAVALSPPMALIAERVAKRVDAQFEQGLMDEIRGLLARGVPETRASVRRPRVPAGARASARREKRGRRRASSSRARTVTTRAGS